MHRAPAQWFLLVSIGAAAIWWPPPPPTPPIRTHAPTNHEGFLALAYSGLRREPDGRAIPVDRFAEHVAALTAAGYQPITLEEAKAFVETRSPLPEKALLLTFDDGRRETALEAEKLLAPLRLPATLFVRADAMEEHVHEYPTWRELRRLARSGRWSFASRGWRARELVETGPGNTRRRGLFLVSRARLGPQGRPEAPAEWAARVSADLDSAVELLQRRIPGWAPIAFGFPCSDDGSGMEDGGAALHRIVESRFPLAFGSSGYAFNPWGRSRSKLTRLEVAADCGAAELVEWLDAHGARRTPFVASSTKPWIYRHGRLEAESAQLSLEPDLAQGSRGAEAWLAGSESWRSLSGELTLETRPDAQAWVFLRASPGRDFIRLGWNGRGIALETRVEGGEIRSVARGSPPPGAEEAAIAFELFERRIRFAVRGGEAPERSFALPPELRAGMAGLGAWLLEGATTSSRPVRFSRLRLEPRPPRAALVRSLAAAQARGGSAAVDLIAPRWYEAQEVPDGLRVRGAADDALATLAAYRGATLWPLLHLPSLPRAASPQNLAEQIDRIATAADAQGLILDTRGAPAESLGWGAAELAALLDAAATPLAIIPGAGLRSALTDQVVERFAWLLAPADGEAPENAPPERVARFEEWEP